jgi:hypothetical protein
MDKWYFPKILDYQSYIDLNESIDTIRWLNKEHIKNGGWHFSYFGTSQFIANKIQNFSHQEYNHMDFTNEESIHFKINNNIDLFDRPQIKFKNESSTYLPPKWYRLLKNKTFALHTNQLCERGTTVALYDYAYHLKKEYSIIILYKKQNSIDCVIKRFEKEFDCYEYSSEQEIQEIVDYFKIKFFYSIRSGEKDFLIKNCKNLIHSVFTYDPHGDIYATVSNSQKWVPHMINLPKIEGNFRKELNIPDNAIVLGRYGGFNEFNISFVHKVINQTNTIYFLFANTKNFTENKNVIYLPRIIDPIRKSMFINTCDAMIHARYEGETFGLSIAEFSTFNKPIITCKSSKDNQHLEILGEKAIIYDSEESLRQIINGIDTIINSRNDWNAYQNFTPERVMDIFYKTFIHEHTPKITLVSAFYDIGRTQWDTYVRSTQTYIDSFKNYYSIDYHMIVFIDSRYIHLLTNTPSITFIPINEIWLKNNTIWSKIEIARSIMNSEKYKTLVARRIENGSPETLFPEYNFINHCKIDFINYAIHHGYINSELVAWSDFGYHNSVFKNDISRFPKENLNTSFFNSKITMWTMNEITEKDFDPWYTVQNEKVIFTGGFYGLPTTMVPEFHKLYHDSLDELHNLGICDDDQHIYLRCYRKNPELFEIHLDKNKWPEALCHFQKRKYLFIITSMVHCTLSVYTPSERYNQTLITIQSIKKYVPDCQIVVIENSREIVFNDTLMFYTENNYAHKSIGECSILLSFLNSDIYKSMDIDIVFKISGRYYLNENFKLYKFDSFCTRIINTKNDPNDKNILPADYCGVSCLFSFPKNKTDIFINTLLLTIDCISKNIINDITKNDIEHYLFKNNFVDVGVLGISGHLAPTGTFIKY